AAWLVLATLAGSQRFVARPDAVSALLFASFLWLLDRDRRRADLAIVWLVPLQILWVNTHTLFGLGPALAWLAALAALIDRARGATRAAASDGPAPGVPRALLVATVVTIACLANPYGVRALGFAI